MRALVLLMLLAGPAAAQPALYQCTAIVTGTDMRERPRGIAECLHQVLVKLTGRPALADDPRVAVLDAAAMVARFDYVDPRAGVLHHDDQGTYDRSQELTVRFDLARVDAALAGLGVARWTGARPLLVPVVLVRSRDPVPFLLTAGSPRGAEMREALARLAAEHGMGIRFPTQADLDAWGVGPVGPPTPLSAPRPGELAVPGTLSWNIQAGGWVGAWHATLDGTEHEWGIRGVGFDVAFADLVRGAVMLAAGTGAP